MATDVLVPHVAADYPNHLAATSPRRDVFARRIGTLAGLVLVCVALRAAMAWRIPSLTPDSAVFIRSAQALEAGDLRSATTEIELNTYPWILMLLHRAGLGWEPAGVLWGVMISSLVVLPLFGWVRRQFDDQVALAACLLYAVQPKMIEWGPEIMRDSTFWFLMVLVLYLLWRAVTEIRLLWFTLAGIGIILACFTRFEGLFLLIPLGLWSFWRWLALCPKKGTVPFLGSRGRLILGLGLCLGLVPALATAAMLLVPGIVSGGIPLRLDPWTHFTMWVEVTIGHTRWDPAALNPLLPDSEPPLSVGRMLRVFFPTMTRGLSPLFALLMFGGMWGWRHVWSRRDHQAPFWTGNAVLVGIWVHLWYDRMICPRYALPIVLLGAPFAALGLLGLTRRVARWTAWLEADPKTSEVSETSEVSRGLARARTVRPRLRAALVAMPAVLVAGIGVSDAMTCNRIYFAARKEAAELGQWLRRTPWPAPMVVGPGVTTPIVNYYAQKGRYQMYRFDTADAAAIGALVARYHPDLLLLRTTKRMDWAQCEMLVEQMKGRGFQEIEPVKQPPKGEPLIVLVRGQAGLAQLLSTQR
jgi:hypothetical protein